jgi:hypothetical protein
MMFMMPMPPTSSDTAPITPRPMDQNRGGDVGAGLRNAAFSW